MSSLSLHRSKIELEAVAIKELIFAVRLYISRTNEEENYLQRGIAIKKAEAPAH
jgi:hypothetical protein